MRHLSARASTLGVLCVLLTASGCDRDPEGDSTTEVPAETTETAEAVVATPPATESLTPEALQEMAEPSPHDYVQACASDDACRVYQPSDWSAGVECCYEYGCGLDYVAISDDMWALIRAWRGEHAFDCVAHVQASGPCNNRPITCGLSQEPPEARCVEGVCQVAYPETWPLIDRRAQTCNMNNECVGIHADVQNARDICCGTCAGAVPVAINTQTRDELRAWRETLDCDAITCLEQGECHPEPVGAQCVAGVCTIR